MNCPACGFDVASCRCDSDPEAVAIAALAAEFLHVNYHALPPDPNRCKRCGHHARAHVNASFGGSSCIGGCPCRVFVGGWVADPEENKANTLEHDREVEDYGG